MVEENEKSHSFRMPMIELVIIIGIFAVISIFLVRMFMGTNRLQEDATNLSRATIKAETVAEQIKNTASIGEAAIQLNMTAYDTSTQNYCMYFDSDWNQTDEPSANIIIITSTITKGDSGRMVSANISAYAAKDIESANMKDVLVSLTAKKWVNSN